MYARPAEAPRLRALNRPRPLRVEADEQGRPIAVWLSGRRCAVEGVLETWRIDDEWWREYPVSRIYYRVALEDGRTVDLYREPESSSTPSLRTGWYRQSY